jgi:hypothetical protein
VFYELITQNPSGSPNLPVSATGKRSLNKVNVTRYAVGNALSLAFDPTKIHNIFVFTFDYSNANINANV